MELIKNHKNISGWGVDADKNVRPNYPMWKVPVQGTGAHWEVPEQQPNFKDFFSNERPGPTHVFGTSVPPSGLSGVIRGFAFKYSEGSWAHWFTLMFADRVNVVEGIFDDVLKGTPPRLLDERGWKMDKKFKTKRYKKVMGLSALAAVAVPLFILSRRKNNSTR
jgi:hypothetical protein